MNGAFHLGDEAMLERAINELRARKFDDICVLTANESDTAQRYGVTTIQQPSPLVIEEADRLIVRPESPDATQMTIDCRRFLDTLRQAIAAADLLLVTGGGNLNSIWPEQVRLRKVAVLVAAQAGTRIVLSGQSLGPDYENGVRSGLTTILKHSDLVGVRERASLELCDRLGIDSAKVFLNPDDASRWNPELGHHRASEGIRDTYALAAFSSWHGVLSNPARHLESCIEIVMQILKMTTGDVLLLPQVGASERDASPLGDEVFHDSIVEQIGDPRVSALRVSSPTVCMDLIRDASLLVSSRYHPVVFAIAEGTPAVGLPVDNYTAQKICGYIAQFASRAFAMPLPFFRLTDFADAVECAVEGVRNTGAVSRIAAIDAHAHQSMWWDYVCNSSNRVPQRIVPNSDFPGACEHTPSHSPSLFRLAQDCTSLSLIGHTVNSSQAKIVEAIDTITFARELESLNSKIFVDSLKSTLAEREIEIVNLRNLISESMSNPTSKAHNEGNV